MDRPFHNTWQAYKAGEHNCEPRMARIIRARITGPFGIARLQAVIRWRGLCVCRIVIAPPRPVDLDYPPNLPTSRYLRGLVLYRAVSRLTSDAAVATSIGAKSVTLPPSHSPTHSLSHTLSRSHSFSFPWLSPI